MAFLISIPNKLKKPSNDIKPKGKSAINKPATTPTTAIGTISQIISGCLALPKSNTLIINITKKPNGRPCPKAACALRDDSNSPPHSSL